jgi:hypothetical protein
LAGPTVRSHAGQLHRTPGNLLNAVIRGVHRSFLVLGVVTRPAKCRAGVAGQGQAALIS